MLTSLFRKMMLPRDELAEVLPVAPLPTKDLSTWRRVSPKLYKGVFKKSLVSSSRLWEPFTLSSIRWGLQLSCWRTADSYDLSVDLPNSALVWDARTSWSIPKLFRCYIALLAATLIPWELLERPIGYWRVVVVWMMLLLPSCFGLFIEFMHEISSSSSSLASSYTPSS